MMMIMRSSITSSPVPPFLLRSLLNPKSLCSHPQFLHKPQFPENPNPERITSEFESDSESEPISQNSVLTQTHVINTLLAHKNNPRSALNHFKQVERKRGFVKSVDAFCVLLHILVGFPETQKLAKSLLAECVFGDSAPAPAVFVDHLAECANRFGFVLDSRVFNYLLNSYVRADRIEDAVLCYNRMIENDMIPWVPFINILLAALVRRNMFGEIYELHNKMVCRGISGDCYTVHVMMRACLKDGKPEKAKEYFREAKAKGIELDAEVYSIVIQAVCKKPNLSLAFVLLKEMKEMGWVPSEGTYTCVIGTCVKHGNMVGCGDEFDEGYCVQGNLDCVLDLFNKIGEDGLSPNKVTYSVLIEWCSKNGNMEKAYELYTQMREKGIQPSVFNVNSLILGYLKSRSLENAFKLFNEAVECGIVNVFTYNNILSWLSEKGKVNEARGIWKKMISKGVEPM